MAGRFDHAQIQHVAQLASLSLTEAEAQKMTGEIAAILKYVDELESLDTSSVPPTAYVQLEASAWREDVVKPGVSRDLALGQAPRRSEDGFAVPGFVETGFVETES
jgi:aspartyl-tRNA(Asn)/glutamyl-tRNA(Gln) amidotransferase subunit C